MPLVRRRPLLRAAAVGGGGGRFRGVPRRRRLLPLFVGLVVLFLLSARVALAHRVCAAANRGGAQQRTSSHQWHL